MSPYLGTFVDTATVYSQDSNGEYTVVETTNLRCRVVFPQLRPVDVGRERNEMTDFRYFSYDPNYTFPNEWCQIVVNGTRYNIVAGTSRRIRNPVGKILVKRFDAVRVQ